LGLPPPKAREAGWIYGARHSGAIRLDSIASFARQVQHFYT
jgi:hypothetical protein